MGFHGTFDVIGKIEAPTGHLLRRSRRRPIHRARRGESSLFRGRRVPLCFAQLSSNEVVDRAAINRAAWRQRSRERVSSRLLFAGNLRDGGTLYARMWHPRWRRRRPRDGGALCRLVGAMASKPDFVGIRPIAFDLARRLDGRPSEIRSGSAHARTRGDSVQRWRRNTYIANARLRCRRLRWCLRPSRAMRPTHSTNLTNCKNSEWLC